MIRVVSHGKQLRRGAYSLHSKFASAVNFSCGNDFAFVVAMNTGAGPLNIVLQGMRLDSLNSLEIDNDSICLNGIRFAFSSSTLFDPRIEIYGYDQDNFKRNLKTFEQALVAFSQPASLAFLLDETRKGNFTSSFDIEYVRRFESAYRTFFPNTYLRGIEMVKGLGPGLTPSGDDFISGLLIALNVRQAAFRIDLSQTIHSIYQIAQGTNPFTNAFLRCAARGEVSEKFKRLIGSLFHSERKEIIESTQRLLIVGATSGADQAVGFLIGLKRF
ncbi:MAG: DUF2877 domain-containing protein [Bacteroidota bacterium]|jgi:hypothetical protein